MDLATLEQQLSDALAQVITEEGQLKAAIDAVKAALPTTVVDPNDALVTDITAALTKAGFTVTPPAPTAPAA